MEILHFGDPALRADPYPVYARLRREAPVIRAKTAFMGEVVLVTRYEDVHAGLKHPLLSSDIRKHMVRGSGLLDAWWVPKAFKTLQDSMITMDDPGHRRLRNLVHQAFTPRVIEKMTCRVQEIADELLDKMARKRKAELLSEFALPLPLTVISEMLGVPAEDQERFYRWSGKYLEVATGDPRILLRELPNGIRLHRFFERLIRERRQTPRDDLLTALVEAETDGDRLTQDELISMIFLLLLAGHETTVNLIGNGMLSLLEFPDQLALLRERPDLIDCAVEELLRHGNPVEHGNLRFAVEDFELGGFPIEKGSVVLLLISSANRDETVFEEPDQLDITREPNRHLSFGFGVHYCLGAPLARLEGRIAILKLVERFPEMQLAVPRERLEWRNATAVRGLRTLPLDLGRSPAA